MPFVRFLKKYIFRECERYNIGLWESPSFLFFVIGLMNVIAMFGTYIISSRLTDEPEITALITIIVSVIIFIIGATIVQGFDRLLEASKMKTEFIRIASHQLRTPLSSLRWANDLLMSGGSIGKPTEEQVEYLGIIKESNQRMLKLINDLLDVTKIEMGNMAIETKPVNLKEVAEAAVKDLSSLAKANNINLVLKAEENLPPALSDIEKSKMVFSNLIDNAIKYSKGRGEVAVSMAKNGNCIQVSVRDEGVGIPKAQQKNIFQKFFRSDNVMKHQTVGSGLGLFIVKAIIDAHKGSIWFESEENKGSVFHFKIPIAK
ncbi:MAG: HAMP domain-containing sensor histidine kinase [bacterium]